jgi:hypothetical protein
VVPRRLGVERDDWRTFRADLVEQISTGSRFTPREPPSEDLALDVTKGVSTAMWRFHAKVTLHVPAESIVGRLPPGVVVEALDNDSFSCEPARTRHRCSRSTSGCSVDFTVYEPPELVNCRRALSDRYQRAITQRP